MKGFLVGLKPKGGKQLFREELAAEPLPDGLLVDRAGRIMVTLIEGGMVCYVGREQNVS